MTPNPVPGPLRKLSAAVVRTELPMGIPPLAVVAVRDGVAVFGAVVGVRVAVAVTGTDVRVGVAVALGPDTSVI